MRRLVILAALFGGICFGQCNAANSANFATACPAICPATANSNTPNLISQTNYTSPGGVAITGVDCWNSIIWAASYPGHSNSGSAPTATGSNAFGSIAIASFYAPANGSGVLPNIEWTICLHSGGGVGGDGSSCLDGGQSTYGPVSLIQYTLDRKNNVGGKGFGVIMLEYFLSTPVGTNVWPVPAQSVYCFIDWLQLNHQTYDGAGAGNLSSLVLFGFSWGANLGWQVANAPESYYGHWSSCPVAAQTLPAMRAAAAYPAFAWATPVGNSGLDSHPASGSPPCTSNCVANGQGLYGNAMGNALNCGGATPVLATCRTNDASLQASPLYAISNTNSTNFSSWGAFLQWGGPNDTTVQVAWNNGTPGGQMYLPIQYYNALSTPIHPAVVQYTYGTCGGVSAGGHLGDVCIKPFPGTVLDQINNVFDVGPRSGGNMTGGF